MDSAASPSPPCTCDPTQDAINDPECPRHGAEIKAWQAWRRGEVRCPYCVDLGKDDFEATCDCFRFESEFPNSESAA